MTTHDFAFAPRYRRFLSLLGVRPPTAFVVVDTEAGKLQVGFGPWRVETPLANVAGVEITGPFQAVKAIGPRVSFADRGLTFGTNTERAVCIRFREPVRGIEPTGRLRHPGLTVTVADVDALAEELRAQVAAARSD